MANVISKATNFLSASYEELKKVSFPSFSEAKKTTFLTIVVVLLVALIIFIFDAVLQPISKILMPTLH